VNFASLHALPAAGKFYGSKEIRRASSVRKLAGRTDLGAALLSLEFVTKGTEHSERV